MPAAYFGGDIVSIDEWRSRGGCVTPDGRVPGTAAAQLMPPNHWDWSIPVPFAYVPGLPSS